MGSPQKKLQDGFYFISTVLLQINIASKSLSEVPFDFYFNTIFFFKKLLNA